MAIISAILLIAGMIASITVVFDLVAPWTAYSLDIAGVVLTLPYISLYIASCSSLSVAEARRGVESMTRGDYLTVAHDLQSFFNKRLTTIENELSPRGRSED